MARSRWPSRRARRVGGIEPLLRHGALLEQVLGAIMFEHGVGQRRLGGFDAGTRDVHRRPRPHPPARRSRAGRASATTCPTRTRSPMSTAMRDSVPGSFAMTATRVCGTRLPEICERRFEIGDADLKRRRRQRGVRAPAWRPPPRIGGLAAGADDRGDEPDGDERGEPTETAERHMVTSRAIHRDADRHDTYARCRVMAAPHGPPSLKLRRTSRCRFRRE